jgi:hypothetical protein
MKRQRQKRFGYAGKTKARITQSDLTLETKGMDQRDASCWANFILTANNDNPVKEEEGGRRRF